jgi:hypothetical protein
VKAARDDAVAGSRAAQIWLVRGLTAPTDHEQGDAD